MIRKSLVIHPEDTVAVLLENAFRGDTIQISDGEITLLQDVEFAHKVSISDHEKGQFVYKYGHEIGYMAVPVPKGTWIHSHNMLCDRGRQEK